MKAIYAAWIAATLLAGANANGTAMYAPPLLTANPEKKITYGSPAWSPHGHEFAYVRRYDWRPGMQLANTGESVYLATLRNGKWDHRLLADGADDPTWSADGRLLALDRNGLAVYDRRTGRIQQLQRSGLPKSDRDEATAYYDSPLAFSPDGRYIAYLRNLWEGIEIRVFDRQRKHDLGINLGNRFAFSPDSRFALAATNWYEDQQSPTRLVLWNLSSREMSTILDGYRTEDIIWPKGRTYAWVVLQDPLAQSGSPKTDRKPPHGPGVYRLDMPDHRLTKLSDTSTWMVASPDYGRVAYVSRPSDQSGPASLYTGYTQTWRSRSLAKDAASWDWWRKNTLMGWSPDGRSLSYVTFRGDVKTVGP